MFLINKQFTNLLHISTTADLTMRLLLLLTEQSKEGGLGDANNLETDTGDITDGMTGTTETSNEDFIVFINVVQTTIARNEGGDLLTVLDKLNTDALTNSRVRLLSFNTTTNSFDNVSTYTFSRTIPLAIVAPPRTLALMEEML